MAARNVQNKQGDLTTAEKWIVFLSIVGWVIFLFFVVGGFVI
ncbi:MAG: hypothetical protein V1802_02550 [Candidatus Aenigmatarchaeota archaeon]